MIRAVAPGRVNLIGEYTDIVDGLVLPMAIDRATIVEGERSGDAVILRSADRDEVAVVPLEVTDPSVIEPTWARHVAGVVAEVGPEVGFEGTVATTIPIGAGLSSSAALAVAVALAIGAEGTPADLAAIARRAEQAATGVPIGIMDQLASTSGVAGHALLIDCATLGVTPTPMPDDLEVRVIHSGQERELAGSTYGARVEAARSAAEEIGPLRLVTDPSAVEQIADPLVRRRARHIVTENLRVRALAEMLAAGDRASIGELMEASHRSMRDDLEISTSVIDELVERLTSTPGVIGARLTGAGFGGCVVAITEPGAIDEGWPVTPADGARLDDAD